ncbi:MAG: EamA family transporter [Chloroflexi bacterium]|nr:EamA family transporter [Chloroflexota bacterium]
MQIADRPHRSVAVAESLLVTIIWASSFIFVKIALNYMGPITIAGLRYFGAFVLLLPFSIRNYKSSQPISRALWIRLIATGISAYTIGNGAFFWRLKYLSATTVSFLTSLLPLLILLLGTIWLKETPSLWQILGMIISLVGSGLFFSEKLQADELLGIFIISIGLIGFALFGVLGRGMARDQQVDTLSLTAIPLAIGGGALMLIAFLIEGMPAFNPITLGIMIWLATVNTAFAYILYNHALQALSALEMNIMLNLSPLGTALFAWLLLDERLNIVQIAGMVTVLAGVVLVQQTGKRLKT